MDSQFQITYAIGKYNIRKMYNVDFRRKKTEFDKFICSPLN